MQSQLLVALAGQPNCGKSTLFNMLTGARQHVANYPGVTVEKKSGRFRIDNDEVVLVDLPGTYSLTSYSLEERVARDFVLNDRPQAVIDVADASNLRRHLYLTLQLLEMEVPVILALNMMDVAERRHITIDVPELEKRLGTKVVPTVGRNERGANALKSALKEAAGSGEGKEYFALHYGAMEPYIEKVSKIIEEDSTAAARFPVRWMAVKLLEQDSAAVDLLKKSHAASAGVLENVTTLRKEFENKTGVTPQRHIAHCRHRAAGEICRDCLHVAEEKAPSFSDKADNIICHKIGGPLFLIAVLFVLYQVSIVFGNWLALQAWPIWGGLENFVSNILPAPGFLTDPLVRSLGVWVVKSTTAILNYLPIFFLLFSLIAILEDSGYMPRMAFILDRIFRRFGLHGQSTLPLILGGVYVGGCAIPAVMSTKAIPDERARLATILIVPMMNCLAKVPLYLLLIGAYFADTAGAAMFFIATVTMLIALPVAKILSLTVLKKMESAPFIMEMPPYHLPRVNSVLKRAFERIWLFIKKIVTVVVAVAVVVFVLINFPGPSEKRMAYYEGQQHKAVSSFMKAVSKTSYKESLTAEDVTGIILFGEQLRNAKRGLTDRAKAKEINASFAEKNPVYYAVISGKGADGKKLRRALRKTVKVRKKIRREMRAERFENSFLGYAGHAIEPVTQYAGFNWRINIALLSAFAAKENSAATLGAIYGIDGNNMSVQDSMKSTESGFTALHALALMLFMALYPPCVPTSIMVRMQTNSSKWMLFSIFYQIVLGLFVAVLIFSGGSLLGLTGTQAMWVFYGFCLIATIVTGFIPQRDSYEITQSSGLKKEQAA